MIRLVNISKEKCDIYIGRREQGMHYGNPASNKRSDIAVVFVKTRKEAIQFYREWLDGKHPNVEPERRLWILDHLDDLRDKVIGCHCYPKPCHGDVLIEMIEHQDYADDLTLDWD